MSGSQEVLCVNTNERERRFRLTVEPALLLLTFSVTLNGPVIQNLVLYRMCINDFHLNQTTCENLKLYPDIEAIIQPKATVLFMTKELIGAFFPALLSFFLGPWSDIYGRKPLIVIPLIGYVLNSLGLFFFSFGYAESWPIYLLLLPTLPQALSGGFVSFVTGAFCMVADVSSENERAWRMGIMEAALLIGFPLGLASSSFILAWGGYQLVFGLSALAPLLAFFYVVFFVKETVSGRNEMTTYTSSLRAVFDKRLIYDMFSVCLKKRPGYRRLANFLIMFILASQIFTLDGELSVIFLYTQKKFEWGLREYSLFSSISVIIATFGTLGGLHLLSKKFNLPDAQLAAFAMFTKAMSAVTLGLAPTPWVLYLGSTFNLLGGLGAPLGRTILSKSVAQDDIGKLFSLASSIDALTPIAAAPLYTLVYNQTIISFPGMFYILSAGIYILDFVVLCMVAFIQYKFPSPESYAIVDQDPADTTVQ